MRKSILILLLFLIPTGSFAEPEFHKGSVSIKSFTDDGSFKVTGQNYDSYGFDGNGTDISGNFFVENKLAFGFSKKAMIPPTELITSTQFVMLNKPHY